MEPSMKSRFTKLKVSGTSALATYLPQRLQLTGPKEGYQLLTQQRKHHSRPPTTVAGDDFRSSRSRLRLLSLILK